MHIKFLTPVMTAFKSRREDRNTVNQLTKDEYPLTENNQIKINKAIDSLAKEKGDSNIDFLLGVARNLQYGTNITNGRTPKNNWKERLHDATKKSLAISDPITKEKYSKEIETVFDKKELNDEEKDILQIKTSILSKVDEKQLKKETNPNIKNINKNLDAFIISSEVPLKQKKYILSRLDYMLSPEYEINPQLKDKKTNVFAEMINDLVVNTKDSKIPNTKAINQKHHGMCAAISIARKMTSYEDKVNYVDSILSELDATDYIMVHDRSKLGQNVKIPVKKTFVDFDEADKKGYRIVDASTLQWMNIANTSGVCNTQSRVFIPFDSQNFGTYDDSTFITPIEDPQLKTKHAYYQSLLKAKEVIGGAKATKIKTKENHNDLKQSFDSNIKYLKDLHTSLKETLHETVPSLPKENLLELTNNIISLRHETSEKINKEDSYNIKYSFLPNEEQKMKQQKIANYIKDTYFDTVDEKILDKNISEITQKTEEYVSLDNSLKNSSPKPISHARKMYEAAAAYRNSVVASLNDNEYLANSMVRLNVKDSESLLIDNLDKTIKHIDKTNDKRYLEHFSNIFETKPDKVEVLPKLEAVKMAAESFLTEDLDVLYALLGFGNRRIALISDIEDRKTQINEDPKNVLPSLAYMIGKKPNDKKGVFDEYERFKEQLTHNGSEEEYINIFNKIGNKNQLQSFADTFGFISNALKHPEIPECQKFVKNFNFANGLEENATQEESFEKLANIGLYFNEKSKEISTIGNLLIITDENGKTINSPEPRYVVLKKLEKDHVIESEDTLIPLRDRFNNIDKLRSQDEFSSRQGKIDNRNLKKLSQPEKETVKRIDRSINRMYSDVNKELAFVMSEIRKPLEEHARKIGVMEGSYWTSPEGNSGLLQRQEVKIAEMITGRKYYIEKDTEKAIDTIKNTPYSGITASSVFHDREGGHAQYVAEVSPVGKDGKDVLYHDNTWGASELENTWVDSEGLTRTDYSDRRGGELGYITNNQWRNGNYVDNLVYKTGHVEHSTPKNKQLKKLSGKDESYDFPLVRNTIIVGNDKEIKGVAATIHDSVLIDEKETDILKKNAEKLTTAEIEAAIRKNKLKDSSYHKIVEDFNKEIITTPFHRGIDSKEDFDALPGNDIVKLTFAKIALSESYPKGISWTKLAKAKDLNDIEKIKSGRNDIAKENFEYAFGKTTENLYGYTKNRKANKSFEIVETALKNNNIPLSKAKTRNIVKNIGDYKAQKDFTFDGSLKNCIKYTVNQTLSDFDKIVPNSDSDNAIAAKKEIEEKLTKNLKDELYINSTDLEKLKSTKFNKIIMYIDKKYAPNTDEELINIYRNLQDMTKDEFSKETSDATIEDYGVKEVDPYDLLRRYKGSDQGIKNTVKNMLYQQEIVKDYNFTNKTIYKYYKLTKANRGQQTKNMDSFDNVYRTISTSLTSLDYEKLFKPIKESSFKNYKVFPAYPKVSVLDISNIDERLEQVHSIANKTKTVIKSSRKLLDVYNTIDNLNNIVNSIPDDGKPNNKQLSIIHSYSGNLLSAIHNDSTIPNSINASIEILNLNKDADKETIKGYVDAINEEFKPIKAVSTPESLNDKIKTEGNELKKLYGQLISKDIPEKYRATVTQAVNEWLNYESKDSKATPAAEKLERLKDTLDSASTKKRNYKVMKNLFLDNLQTSLNTITQSKNGRKANQEYRNDLLAETEDIILTSIIPLDNEKSKQCIEKVQEIINTNKKLSKKDISAQLSPIFEDNIDSKETNKLINQLHSLNNTKLADNKYVESFNTALKNIEETTNQFVSGNIKPEKQKAIINTVQDITRYTATNKTHKYNEEIADKLYENFCEKYTKHTYLNQPEELLKEYAFSIAKDGQQSSSDPVKAEEAKKDSEGKKSLIDSLLKIAKMVEIQEELMEAVGTGNEGLVLEKFNEFDSGLVDKKTKVPLPMDDDLVVNYMVNNMIVGDNFDTAVMFLDTLGLSEKYLESLNKNYDKKEMMASVDKMINILGKTSKQLNIINVETAPLKDSSLDSNPRWEETFNTVKENIIDKSKRLKNKKVVNKILADLDSAKDIIDATPGISKSLVLTQKINKCIQEIRTSKASEITEIQEAISSYDKIFNLVNSLSIPEYSSGYQEKEKFIQAFNEVQEYNSKQITPINEKDDPFSL